MGKKAVSFLLFNLTILVTALVAYLSCLAFVAGYVQPKVGEWWSFLALLMPLFILSNLLFLLYWLIRKPVMCLFPLIGLLAGVDFATSMVVFSEDKAICAEKTIKVASYNIHEFKMGYFESTLKQVLNTLHSDSVDIICFQEFSKGPLKIDSILSIFKPFYPYSYTPIANEAWNTYDAVVFSRFPLENCSKTYFANQENFFVTVDVRVNSHFRFRLVNRHLATTALSAISRKTNKTRSWIGKYQELGLGVDSVKYQSAVRIDQINTLIDLVRRSELPTILCGDFNDIPSAYAYRKLAEYLTDAARYHKQGYTFTYNRILKLLRIDYIYHTPQLKGIDYQTPMLPFSDHNPVVFTFQCPD